MSLMKMLTMARSLRSGRDKDVRFEIAQESLVPNFARGGPSPASIVEEPKDSRGGRTSSVPSAAAGAPKPQGELSLGGASTRTSGIMSRLAAGRWHLGGGAAKPVLRADSKGQLSLQLVKVVRNDLSDSDLEVVPSRKPAAPPSAAASEPVEESLEPEASRWSRFATRFLRPGAGG
ncbi:MAG: hypothetical protein HYR88_18485 [Verrucomicrobia bacterium]|nr:hypothetical protein [Verrucomicrobiota bacterium]